MAFVCSELLALREELAEVSAAAASAHSSGAETSRLSESLAAAEKQLQAAKNRIDELEEEVGSIEQNAMSEVFWLWSEECWVDVVSQTETYFHRRSLLANVSEKKLKQESMN